MVWTAWYENLAGETPSPADLEALIADRELTHTVLADPGGGIDHIFDPDGRTRPTWVLIAPGGEVISAGLGLSEGDVIAALPEGAP